MLNTHSSHILCPFHRDKNPSLRLYFETQTFYCFGCETWGIIKENQLIPLNGIKRKELCLCGSGEKFENCCFKKFQDLKEKVKEEIFLSPQKIQILSNSAKDFHQNLFSGKYPQVLNYLIEERGILPEILKKCLVGYTDETFYQSYISYPNFDSETGEINYITYRGYPQKSHRRPRKDLIPRKNLYLEWTLKEVKEKKYLLIVEGEIDGLTIYQVGLPVVSLYGAHSFAKEDAKRLLNYNFNSIIVALDGDEAGKKATQKILSLFPEKGKVKALLFPSQEFKKEKNLEIKDWNELLVKHFEKNHSLFKEFLHKLLEGPGRESYLEYNLKPYPHLSKPIASYQDGSHLVTPEKKEEVPPKKIPEKNLTPPTQKDTPPKKSEEISSPIFHNQPSLQKKRIYFSDIDKRILEATLESSFKKSEKFAKLERLEILKYLVKDELEELDGLEKHLEENLQGIPYSEKDKKRKENRSEFREFLRKLRKKILRDKNFHLSLDIDKLLNCCEKWFKYIYEKHIEEKHEKNEVIKHALELFGGHIIERDYNFRPDGCGDTWNCPICSEIKANSKFKENFKFFQQFYQAIKEIGIDLSYLAKKYVFTLREEYQKKLKDDFNNNREEFKKEIDKMFKAIYSIIEQLEKEFLIKNQGKEGIRIINNVSLYRGKSRKILPGGINQLHHQHSGFPFELFFHFHTFVLPVGYDKEEKEWFFLPHWENKDVLGRMRELWDKATRRIFKAKNKALKDGNVEDLVIEDEILDESEILNQDAVEIEEKSVNVNYRYIKKIEGVERELKYQFRSSVKDLEKGRFQEREDGGFNWTGYDKKQRKYVTHNLKDEQIISYYDAIEKLRKLKIEWTRSFGFIAKNQRKKYLEGLGFKDKTIKDLVGNKEVVDKDGPYFLKRLNVKEGKVVMYHIFRKEEEEHPINKLNFIPTNVLKKRVIWVREVVEDSS